MPKDVPQILLNLFYNNVEFLDERRSYPAVVAKDRWQRLPYESRARFKVAKVRIQAIALIVHGVGIDDLDRVFTPLGRPALPKGSTVDFAHTAQVESAQSSKVVTCLTFPSHPHMT